MIHFSKLYCISGPASCSIISCNGYQIPVDDVLNAVFTSVQQQLLAAGPTSSDGSPCLTLDDIHQQQYEDQVADIMDSKRRLYEEYVAGVIDAEAFQKSKASLDETLARTKSAFAAMKAKVEEMQIIQDRHQQRQQLLDDLQTEGTLSNDLAERIIDRIIVYSDRRIEIVYKIADLLE